MGIELVERLLVDVLRLEVDDQEGVRGASYLTRLQACGWREVDATKLKLEDKVIVWADETGCPVHGIPRQGGRLDLRIACERAAANRTGRPLADRLEWAARDRAISANGPCLPVRVSCPGMESRE